MLRSNFARERAHILVAGGYGCAATKGARRLLVHSHRSLWECLESLRQDVISLRTLGAHDQVPSLIVIEACTRELGAEFAMGRDGRTRVRPKIGVLAMHLRALAADGGVAVVLITARHAARLGRAWSFVCETRLILVSQCAQIGCDQETNENIDGVTRSIARRKCEHVRVEVLRKDGPKVFIELDLVEHCVD